MQQLRNATGVLGSSVADSIPDIERWLEQGKYESVVLLFEKWDENGAEWWTLCGHYLDQVPTRLLHEHPRLLIRSVLPLAWAGKDVDAFALLRLAEQKADEQGIEDVIIDARICRANLFFATQRYDEALTHFCELERGELQPKRRMQVLNGLGLLHATTTHDLVNARRFFDELEATAAAEGDPVSFMIALINRCWHIDLVEGRFGEARQAAHKLIAMRGGPKDSPFAKMCGLLNLGMLEYHLGRPSATQTLADCADLSRKLGFTVNDFHATALLADTFAQMGQVSAAEEQLERAEALAAQEHSWAVALHWARGRIAAQRGDIPFVRRELEAALSADLEPDIGVLNLCECARVYLLAGLESDASEVAAKAVDEATRLGMKFVAVRARAIWCVADPSRLREHLSRSLTDSLYRGYDEAWVLREPELSRRLLTQALAMEIEPEYARSLLDRLGIPTVRISLFGGLRVWVGNREVSDADWTRPKARALFAYLSLKPYRMIDPNDVLELFWPMQDIDEARNSLRVAVSYLRKALEPGRPKGSESTYIQYDGHSIQLNPGEAGWVDAEAFGRLADRALKPNRTPVERMRLAERALELVHGDLLPEYGTDPALEEDIERWNARVRDVRRELARSALECGYPEVALGATRDILVRDPLDEPAVLLEVQALKALGQSPEARQTLSDYLRRWARKAKAPASKPVRDLAATLWTDPAHELPEPIRCSFMN